MQSTYMPSAYTFLAMLNYAMWKRLFLQGEPLDTLLEELERGIAQTDQSTAQRA